MDRAWQLAPGVAVRSSAGTPEAEALAEVFPGFEIAEAVGAPRLSTSDVGNAGLRVSLEGLALFTAQRDELAPALEAALIGWMVRTTAGVVPLHASAVRWADMAVLFLGDKGSGKSTLAAQLGAVLPYLGDEVALVRISDRMLVPFPKAATIKAGAFGVMPVAREWQDPLRGPVRYCTPAVTSRAEVRVGALVWPCWSATAARELTPLEPAEAAVRLIHQSFGGLERDSRTLDTVVALAALPAFELAYSTAATARKMLEGALGPP